jgi:hypothetical protein
MLGNLYKLAPDSDGISAAPCYEPRFACSSASGPKYRQSLGIFQQLGDCWFMFYLPASSNNPRHKFSKTRLAKNMLQKTIKVTSLKLCCESNTVTELAQMDSRPYHGALSLYLNMIKTKLKKSDA